MAKKVAKKRVVMDPETFITAYAKAKKAGRSMAEFSKESGISTASIQQRKINYKKAYGITFPKLAQKRLPKLDPAKVKELQKLLNS